MNAACTTGTRQDRVDRGEHPTDNSGEHNPIADKRVNADLVERLFTTSGANRLWLTEVTEHPIWEGKVYCCVVLGCFAWTPVSRFSLQSRTRRW